MATYSQKQIEELAKMGVIVTPEGMNLSKETRLERLLRVKNAELVLSKEKAIVKTQMFSGIVANTGGYLSPKSFTREGIFSFSDQERYNQGLVTEKIPGYVYTTMDDGTKICRCCQDRKESNYYSNCSTTVDNKMIICKDCDCRKGKTYRAAKQKAAKKASKAA